MEDYTHLWPDIKFDSQIYRHNTIRLDIKDTIYVLNRIYENNNILKWEIEYLLIWWKRVCENINQYHNHQKKFFFPFLKHKIMIDDNFYYETVKLNELMVNVSTIIVFLKDYTSVLILLESLENFEYHMFNYLDKIENEILPLLRKRYTPIEFKPVLKLITSEYIKHDLPHLYRQLTLENKFNKVNINEHLTKVMNISKINFWYNFSKYESIYINTINKLKYPDIEIINKKCCFCF